MLCTYGGVWSPLQHINRPRGVAMVATTPHDLALVHHGGLDLGHQHIKGAQDHQPIDGDHAPHLLDGDRAAGLLGEQLYSFFAQTQL